MALQLRGGVWYLRTKSGGQDKRISTGTGDRAQAEIAAKRIMQEREEALTRALKPTGPTLDAMFRRVIKEHYHGLACLTTIAKHQRAIYEAIPKDTPIDHIKADQYSALVEHLRLEGLANGTINRHFNTLCCVLRHAVDWELLEYVPKRPRLKESKGRTKTYDKAEERAIIAEFRRMKHPEMAQLVIALVDTGIRLGEFVDRKHHAHNAKAKTLHVWDTKNGDERMLPLTDRANEALRELLGAEPLRKDQIEDRWKVMRRNLGKDDEANFVIHALRHTCCTRLAEAGWNDQKIMRWMGHRDINTTMRYTHLNDKKMREGAEALAKLEEEADA